MDCSQPDFSFTGFPRQGHWTELPFHSPGIEPVSSALTGRFFTAEPPGKSQLLFVSPSFLKGSFSSILFWFGSFSFNILNMSFHSLLVWKFSAEKHTDSLMEFPCIEWVIFSLVALKIFCLSFTFNIIVCLGMIFFGLILLGVWSSCTWISVISSKIWEVFSYYYFK